MFANDMKEKNENLVVIEDIENDVFEEFLKFIYFSKLDKIETMAIKLLKASDKYNVIELKSSYEDFLTTELSIRNAIQTLYTAEQYNSQKLEFNAIDYIASNLAHIRSAAKNQWLELMRTNILLADKIVERALAVQSQDPSSHFLKVFTYRKF
jgi:hypothetical protein